MNDMWMTDERGPVPLDELTHEEAIAALKMSLNQIESSRDTARKAFDLLRLRRRA